MSLTDPISTGNPFAVSHEAIDSIVLNVLSILFVSMQKLTVTFAQLVIPTAVQPAVVY